MARLSRNSQKTPIDEGGNGPPSSATANDANDNADDAAGAGNGSHAVIQPNVRGVTITGYYILTSHVDTGSCRRLVGRVWERCERGARWRGTASTSLHDT